MYISRNVVKNLKIFAVSLKGHHNLSWTGDAVRRKVSIFKSQPQTLLKELFQLKPSENCCQCPLCILDLNSSCYSYTNSLKCQEGCTCNKSAQKVPPKKCKKGAKYSSNKSMRTFKSAKKGCFY